MSDRIFDVDWGQLVHSVSRAANTPTPSSDTFTSSDDNGTIIYQASGQVIVFQEIYLEQLTLENRVLKVLSQN